MDQSPLNRLAPELRNIIYELAFQQNRPIPLVHTHGRGWQRPFVHGDQHNILALTHTCRLIHGECGQLFYNVNSFTVRTGKADDVHFLLNSFRSRIGTRNAITLRSIMIEAPRFIWTGLSQLRKIGRPLTEFVTALEQECICHPACSFGVKFSFEFGEGQPRYGPYLRRVVSWTIDVRYLRALWLRIFKGLLAQVKENEGRPHTKAALRFLFFELVEWRDNTFKRQS